MKKVTWELSIVEKKKVHKKKKFKKHRNYKNAQFLFSRVPKYI